MENKNKIIIMLIALILMIGSYTIYLQLEKYNESIEFRVYNESNNAYEKGLNDGSVQIINTINQEGKIPVIMNENNQTSIQWFSIQEIYDGRNR